MKDLLSCWIRRARDVRRLIRNRAAPREFQVILERMPQTLTVKRGMLWGCEAKNTLLSQGEFLGKYFWASARHVMM